MMYTQNLERAKAHLAFLRRMASASESPLMRASFRSRLQEAEGRVKQAEVQASALAEVSLRFDGRPVVGTFGVEAGFGGEGLKMFQDLLSTVSADMQPGGVGERGPLPTQPRLLLSGVETGSFGFQLTEAHDQVPLLPTPSLLKRAAEQGCRLLMAAAESDDSFLTLLSAHHPRVLSRLSALLEMLHTNRATLRVEAGSATARLNTEEIQAASERVAATIIQEREQEIEGRITGLLPGKRLFELQPVTGDALSGRLAPGIGLEEIAALYGTAVLARVRQIHVARLGSARSSWVLMSATAR